MATGRTRCFNWFRKAWLQGRVWSAAIVVADELTKDELQMPLAQRDQVVQALSPNRANHSLAISIRHRAPHRCFQDSQAEALQCRINLGREDAVTIVNKISMGGFSIQ